MEDDRSRDTKLLRLHEWVARAASVSAISNRRLHRCGTAAQTELDLYIKLHVYANTRSRLYFLHDTQLISINFTDVTDGRR